MRSGYLVSGSVVNHHLSVKRMRTDVRVLGSVVGHHEQQDIELRGLSSEVIMIGTGFRGRGI